MFGVVRAITVVTVVRSIAILIIKIAVNIAMIVLSCVVVGFLKIFDAVVVVVRFVDGLVGEVLFLGLVFVFVLLRVVYRCLV